MSDYPTFAELFRVQRDEMLSRSSQLTLEIIERQGSDANALVAGAAAGADEAITQLALTEASLFLDSSKDEKLDRLVFDRYGLTRKPASPAVGSVNFTTTAPATGTFAIPINTRLQTADGRQFITTAAATFLTGTTGPVVVAVRSVLAGIDQQARIGTITSITSVISGAPNDLVVNNSLATAGADDEESDESLRTRARQFFTTARRGTVKALQAGALAVPGVRTATVFETLDAFGRPAKHVQLFVSDAFTDQLALAATVPASYEAQSQVLAASVFAGLDDVRAAGIFVDVRVAQVVLQGIQLGLRFAAGADVESVTLQARAAIVSHINSLAPGVTLTVEGMLNALRLINGLIVTGQEIISPAGNVQPFPLQVIRSSLSLVLAVAQQPTTALQSTTNPDSV